LAVSMEKDSVL